MRIYLTDQTKNFPNHLNRLRHNRVIDYKISELKEKKTSIRIESGVDFNELNTDFFFDYDIFPHYILTYFSEWRLNGRKMKTGDTIVQQAFLPPIKSLSQKVIFGVRINEIIDEKDKKGFSYETLEGHVEKGISTFVIEENAAGIFFTIHTFSSPGNVLTRLLGPVFSIPYQTYCTRKALEYVRKKIETGDKYLSFA